MPFRKSYGRKRMPTRAARKYKRKSSSARSTPVFKKKVMAVVRRAAEKKMKVFSITTGTGIQGSGLLGAGQGYTANTVLNTMQLAQGVEQEQRVGNVVTNCRLRVRGCIVSQPSNITSNIGTIPYETHMVVYKNKKDPVNNFTDSIKSLPGNNVGPIDGSLISSVYPFNRDLYKIAAVRKFNMVTHNDLTGPSDPSTASNQGFGKLFHRFDVDCGINKTIKFEDGNNIPTNEWVGVAFYNINADGSISTAGQFRSVAVMDGVFTFNDM